MRFKTPDLLATHGVHRGVHRAINVILQGEGAPYGVLEVDSRSEGKFSEDDIAFLQGTANILGMAIERQRQERALNAALERQQVLVKEINHRVKNSLQLVASMLRLQAGEDPRLQEAASRIMAIGRVHDRLYRSPEIERVELSDYLSDISRDLNEVTPNCDISFGGLEPCLIDTDRAINIVLIVTELVTNAAKYAYPDGRHGSVWVRLARANGDVLRVSVRDEGVGLPADFETNIGKGSGFGMRVVAALARQARATLHIERCPRGAEFALEIGITSR